MITCKQCNKTLKVGDEVHVIDEHTFCSDECAIVYLMNEIICNAKEVAKETYNDSCTILTLRPTSNVTACSVCGKNLAECETIWAAEGKLYCSRDCGVKDYKLVDDDSQLTYASEIFDFVAEEINPKDIGLEVQND